MRFLIIVLIISMMLIPAQNAFALPAKMDCTSILDEWSRVNYPSGNFVHDVIPPVTIDGKNTSFFIKAEQSTKNDNHIQLEMKLLDRNDHTMENSKFFVELLQEDKIIHRDLFYTSSGILVLDFDQNNSTKETTIDAEQPNMGYFSSSSDHITVNSPTLDGTYQLKVTAIGACDKMVFFFPQEAVPIFRGSFLISDGHVNGVTVLKGSNPEKIASPLKQFKSGISIDEIQCKEGLQLVIKSSNGNPACVKQSSIPHLVQISWITSTKIQFENYDDKLAYYLEDGKIVSTNIRGFKMPDKECVEPGCGFDHTSQIIISTDIKKDGIFVLILPIQTVGSSDPTKYSILLVDGWESNYLTSSNSLYQILSFNVTSNTKAIEVFLGGKYNENLPLQ